GRAVLPVLLHRGGTRRRGAQTRDRAGGAVRRLRVVLFRLRAGRFEHESFCGALYGSHSALAALRDSGRLVPVAEFGLHRPVRAVLRLGLGCARQAPSQSFRSAKFALGLMLMGSGFLVMAAAAAIVASGSKVSPNWLTMTYLLHTFGELCLSPVGLSYYTKLTPKRFVGQMMGMWFLAMSLGNLV